MSYIGAQPTTGSFPFDQFSGDGSTTAFTLTYAPASSTSIIVAISGVVQNPNLYSVIGTTITFSPAPPTGTNNISVLYLGLPVIGVSSPGNTAYFSSTSFTATASQTTFTPSGSYQVGFINVIRNGSQLAPADYTATNGTTVVLNNACTAGDIVVIEVYTLTSISNALPLTGGTVTGASTFNAGVNLAVSSGNVGIGTSSPTQKIEGYSSQTTDFNAMRLWSEAAASGTSYTYLNIEKGSGYGGAIAGYLQQGVGSGLAFFSNNDGTRLERARIDSNGNFFIATTTSYPGDGNNTGGLFVEKAGDGTSLFVSRSGGYSVLFLNRGNNGEIVSFRNAGSGVGNISIGSNSTSYNSGSDYRLKYDIQPMAFGLSTIAALKPVTYKWKNDDSDGEGFIAHELQAVLPLAVTGEKDAVNEDGSIKPQSVDYSKVVVHLVAALQEQQSMIEELKAKVAALEAK